ncbi:MAG: glycosyltransferase family 2 protein [Nitrospirae bacterium]|nr:glycosyltransferase family 2 protein [Nitrospirota bacterium]
MNLSIIIPAYNESKNILDTIIEIKSILETIPEITLTEIIVVDDHSSDNTFDIVVQLADEQIKCFRLSKRSGSHTAVRAGLTIVSGDAVIALSADGQDDPNSFREMVNKNINGAKVVWALRKNRDNEPWYIKIPALLFYKVFFSIGNIENNGIDLSRADFFLLDRVVINALNQTPERNTSLSGLIAWLGFKQDFVEYDRRDRKSGRSKWSFRSRMRLAKDWIIAFSGLPLKMMPVLGILIASLGFLYAVVVILNALIGNPTGGWSSLMVVALILGGTQIIMLGIIGEYLWRNLDESRRRPLFFIEKSSYMKDSNNLLSTLDKK